MRRSARRGFGFLRDEQMRSTSLPGFWVSESKLYSGLKTGFLGEFCRAWRDEEEDDDGDDDDTKRDVQKNDARGGGVLRWP